ncbi:hypothetical protein F2P79_009837 [Pimephales promelas]|nr:hypothetical protein F2P79_009837 [Pimephales promelas]
MQVIQRTRGRNNCTLIPKDQTRSAPDLPITAEETPGPAQLQRQEKKSTEKRTISWRELLEMEASRIRFLLRATYDVLLSPQ